VVATDLPLLTAGFLDWLAEHPTPRSLIPVVDGRPQTLCARYSPADLDLAVELTAAGQRAMRDLLDRIDAQLADRQLWEAAAGNPDILQDVDTPADLDRLKASSS
jgi:molybdopterin-guanine dinucleotide biosynthesis protein A